MEALRDFLRSKYRGCASTSSSRCRTSRWSSSATRNELFPDTPFVFSPRLSVAPHVNSTGVVSELNFAPTLDLAAPLQPEARRVYVVSGADPGSVTTSSWRVGSSRGSNLN
jgi:hypothetical protein